MPDVAYAGKDGFYCSSCFEDSCECETDEKDEIGHCQVGCDEEAPMRFIGEDESNWIHCVVCNECLLHQCLKDENQK